VPIIIDGWNLIRNVDSDIDDTDQDSLDSATELISRLEDFQKDHNDPIIVVFDSANEFLDIDFEDYAKLKVVAAKDADEYIKRYVDKTPTSNRRNIRVVSSDKEVFYYVRSSYAVPLRSEEFWRKLKRRKRDVQSRNLK
jgi:predicted RNA-binding protein with PIN domain